MAAFVLMGLLVAAAPSTAAPLVGSRDSVLLTAPDDRVLWSHRQDTPRVPASTQKIVTALAALERLGEGFVFETHLYREGEDLRIKGFGDPLLISETVAAMAQRAADQVSAVRHLLLDDTHFAGALAIPGVSASANPYDAPNGALCVNFNTVFFKQENGRYVSAESQTPLLPIVMERIRRSGLKNGRIVLSRHDDETLHYAGHLFAHFLAANGVPVTGAIRRTDTPAPDGPPLMRYPSPFSLAEVVSRLLAFSNNFIANQLVITLGVRAHGAPGTLENGVRVLNRYASDRLGLAGAVLVEGSGISRQNRLTAAHLKTALDRFAPHHQLMSRKKSEWYKTGHLKGVRTRAGYIEGIDGDLYRFVVLINTPGKTTHRIMDRMHRLVRKDMQKGG